MIDVVLDSLCINKYKDLVTKMDLNSGLDCRRWLQHLWKLFHEWMFCIADECEAEIQAPP